MDIVVKDQNTQDCAIVFSEEEFLAGKDQRLELYKNDFIRLLTIGSGVEEFKVKRAMKDLPSYFKKEINNSAKSNFYKFKKLCGSTAQEDLLLPTRIEIAKDYRAKSGMKPCDDLIKLDPLYQELVVKEILTYLSKFCSQRNLIDIFTIYSIVHVSQIEIEVFLDFLASKAYPQSIVNTLVLKNWRKAIMLSLQCKKKGFG